MEEFTVQDNIVLLFDTYSLDSMSLHESFKRAGYQLPAVVIEDDGFLPDDIISVYGSYLGNFSEAEGSAGRPLYFNEIPVPYNWETGGIGKDGKIHHLQEEKGRIIFADHTHKGFVKEVEWYDRKGCVSSKDHYNRYGAVYARTVYSADGRRINKTWFSAAGKEAVVENFVTGDIILNEADGRIKCFSNKIDFILYFLTGSGYSQHRIFFNSLSIPFFIAQRLCAPEKRDILFWQEPVGEEIPGNMRIILHGGLGHMAQIMVQKGRAYKKLRMFGVSEDKVHKLGYLYPFQKENSHKPEAFICTNSDNLENCDEIVKALPQMHFHIAALTTMSPRLMAMGLYDNVSLYPLIWIEEIEEFFIRCDFYFDINHGIEVFSSVRQAFLHNNLIFAFEETVHNRDYISEEHIYPAGGTESMISDILEIMADETVLEKRLRKQREEAAVEMPESYRELILYGRLTKDYEFTYIVLNESYGGNLALSWSFRGRPDGFLIYDASETLIHETDNIYQHYELIQGYGTESGFIVKAYVNTMEGRVIVAESELVYLSEPRFEDPQVSLLISAYNAEDYIARSIDTAVAQSFSQLEIVIVDDGSTDRTPDVIRWYAEKYPNVTAVRQENGGVSEARNAGIKCAGGEYIGFMDNDDMLHPDMIIRLYSSVRKNNCDIAITSVNQIKESGYEALAQYPMKEDIAVTVDEFLSMHFEKQCMFAVVIWNKLYRASLVKEHLFPSIIKDDDAWTPYILSHADNICYLDDRSYEWDRNIRSSTLVDKWLNQSNQELFEANKNAIMFYLENGRADRAGLLKKLAERQLEEFGRIYQYEEYNRLWEEIREAF